MSDADPDEIARRAAERPLFRRLVARYAARALLTRRVPSRPHGPGTELDLVMLSAYPPSHYGTVSRLTRWVPHLDRRGFRTTVLCPCDDATYARFGKGSITDDYAFHDATLENGLAHLRRAATADVVYLHRGVFPFGPWQRTTFEDVLYRASSRVVYDIYDSVWELHRRKHEAASGRLARWLNPADKIERLLRGARAVTVSNEYLERFARPHHPDVTVLPMLLDPEPYVPREHAAADVVNLGWMGGPWNIERLRSVAPALQRAAARVPLRLHVVCSRSIDIPGVEVVHRHHPWSLESELADLQTFDVGLLPLFDDANDRGKSPFKLLQYAAAGLPVVASPVAIDRSLFVHDESIVYATSDDEWVAALVGLASDVRRRARIGAAARSVLESAYSFEAHADRFAALLRRVAQPG